MYNTEVLISVWEVSRTGNVSWYHDSGVGINRLRLLHREYKNDRSECGFEVASRWKPSVDITSAAVFNRLRPLHRGQIGVRSCGFVFQVFGGDFILPRANLGGM